MGQTRKKHEARAYAQYAQQAQAQWEQQWEDYQKRVLKEGEQQTGWADKFGKDRPDLNQWLGGGTFDARLGASDITDRWGKQTATPTEHLKMRDMTTGFIPGAQPKVSSDVNLSGMLRGSVDRPDLEEQIGSQEMGRLGQIEEGERWWESRGEEGHELKTMQDKMDEYEREAKKWGYLSARKREQYEKGKAMKKSMQQVGWSTGAQGAGLAVGGSIAGIVISMLWSGFQALRNSQKWEKKVRGPRKEWGLAMMNAPATSDPAIGGLAEMLEYTNLRTNA